MHRRRGNLGRNSGEIHWASLGKRQYWRLLSPFFFSTLLATSPAASPLHHPTLILVILVQRPPPSASPASALRVFHGYGFSRGVGICHTMTYRNPYCTRALRVLVGYSTVFPQKTTTAFPSFFFSFLAWNVWHTMSSGSAQDTADQRVWSACQLEPQLGPNIALNHHQQP
jgi:hypothetical protein